MHYGNVAAKGFQLYALREKCVLNFRLRFSISLMDIREEIFQLTTSTPGLSTLLIATTKPTGEFFTRSMTSRVWGIMPSSAATTSTTTSVTLAPRARIAENAA